MRDKYADKPPLARFFHRYTGLITFAIIISIVAVSWLYYENTTVFFEHWSCNQVMSMSLDELTPKEFLRYEEIRAECLDAQFMP